MFSVYGYVAEALRRASSARLNALLTFLALVIFAVLLFAVCGCCPMSTAAPEPELNELCFWTDRAGARHVVPECWEHFASEDRAP